jgi:hypothetical protein
MDESGPILQAGGKKSESRTFKKTIGYLEGILLYLRDTLTRKPKVGSVCGLSN